MRYWMPTIPYTPTDIVNRRAASTGSVTYAQQTAYADYNGHYVTVSYKEHAVSGPTWNAEYYWGERVVLARGGFAACMCAARAEYARGAHGTVVQVYLYDGAPESLADQRAICDSHGAVPWSEAAEAAHLASYWTGTHVAVLDALMWKSFPCILEAAFAYTGTAADWPAHRQSVLDARRAAWSAERR